MERMDKEKLKEEFQSLENQCGDFEEQKRNHLKNGDLGEFRRLHEKQDDLRKKLGALYKKFSRVEMK